MLIFSYDHSAIFNKYDEIRMKEIIILLPSIFVN